MQMGAILTVFGFSQSVGAPKALQYKLEKYCNTNSKKKVLQYKLEEYCDAF